MATINRQRSILRDIKEKYPRRRLTQMVAPYMQPIISTAIGQILTSFGPYIALWALAYYVYPISIWWTLILCAVNAFFLVRIFIIQHDCGHQSFFGPHNKTWNNWIGFICSLFSTLCFKYWAKIHKYHHTHSGKLNCRDVGDINFLTVDEYKARNKFRKMSYRVFRHPLFMFIAVPLIYFGITNRLPTVQEIDIRKGTKLITRKDAWIQLYNNLCILFFYLLFGTLLGWEAFLVIQLTTVFIFSSVAFWFFYVQHQDEHGYFEWKEDWDNVLAAFRGATYYNVPRLIQWFVGNINIHPIHHLNSVIPNYQLPKLMRAYPELLEYFRVITIQESLKFPANKLWDEQLKRMIGWKEYQLLYATA